MCLALSAFGESSHLHTCDWTVYVQAMFLVLYAIVFFNREILFYCSYTQARYMYTLYGDVIFYFRPAYKYLHHMCCVATAKM